MIATQHSWRSARSILAVRLDGIGDLLMTTPALRALKEGRRRRSLTLLTSPAGAIAARELPFVDDVMVFNAPWMKSGETAAVSPHATQELVTQLRERAFDAAVVFTVFTQSALPAVTVLHLAGIPRRAAYSRENPYALLTHWRADPDLDAHAGVRHEVQRQIDLVESLGTRVRDTRLSFPVRDDARRSMLASVGVSTTSTSARWRAPWPPAWSLTGPG